MCLLHAALFLLAQLTGSAAGVMSPEEAADARLQEEEERWEEEVCNPSSILSP